MANEGRDIEVYRQFRAFQEKYDYFLMVVAASAIALSVKRTTGIGLSWWMIPLGLASILWGISFLAGCRRQQYIGSTMWANFELLKVQQEKHPETRSNPKLIRAASEGIRNACEFNSDRASLWADVQLYSLIAGAVLFIVWHIIDMALSAT